jgi:hypothetical protein
MPDDAGSKRWDSLTHSLGPDTRTAPNGPNGTERCGRAAIPDVRIRTASERGDANGLSPPVT